MIGLRLTKWRFALLLVPLLCAGCNSKGGAEAVHPVRGQVTYRGQPAQGAKVVFYPIERKDDRTPFPTGEVTADGSFQLTSYRPDDGAPAGDYQVTIIWHEPIPAGVNKEAFNPRDRLRGQYAVPEKSGLRVTITPGSNELQPFELK